MSVDAIALGVLLFVAFFSKIPYVALRHGLLAPLSPRDRGPCEGSGVARSFAGLARFRSTLRNEFLALRLADARGRMVLRRVPPLAARLHNSTPGADRFHPRYGRVLGRSRSEENPRPTPRRKNRRCPPAAPKSTAFPGHLLATYRGRSAPYLAPPVITAPSVPVFDTRATSRQSTMGTKGLEGSWSEIGAVQGRRGLVKEPPSVALKDRLEVIARMSSGLINDLDKRDV
jgi:hypothetical protein